jgi:hypothetical protein
MQKRHLERANPVDEAEEAAGTENHKPFAAELLQLGERAGGEAPDVERDDEDPQADGQQEGVQDVPRT